MIVKASGDKVFSLRCGCDYDWSEDEPDAIVLAVIPSNQAVCRKCGYYGWTLSKDKMKKIEDAFTSGEKV